MGKDTEMSFFVSSALEGKIDKNQFYEEASIGKDIGFIYWDDNDRISINFDSIEIDNIQNQQKIQFECSSAIAGKIIDREASIIESFFGDYKIVRNVDKVIKTKITPLADNLYSVMIIFSFHKEYLNKETHNVEKRV